MSTSATLIATTRPPFLLLTPAVLSLAYAISYWQHGNIDFTVALLIFIAALSAHISVNTFNEYTDFTSGLDFNTDRTPFSGGSGALPANPDAAKYVLLLACFSLGLTTLIGLYFIVLRGWPLILIGLTGIALIISYTRLLTKNTWLCLIAPGLAFGPIFILGSTFILTGEFSISALMASCPLFFLSNNLLLLNQFPDITADQHAGRKHLLIQKGKYIATQILILFYLLAFSSLSLAGAFSLIPTWALLGLIPALLIPKIARILLADPDNRQTLLTAMKLNVFVNLITPVLIAFGFYLEA